MTKLSPAAAQEARNYRVFIQAGDFTLNRDGSPCKFIDLTRIPVSSIEVNSSFPTYKTSWTPDYDETECGFFLRPKLEMSAQWRPNPILPPPGGERLNDLIMVDARLVLQIHDCSRDECRWVDEKVSIVVHTYELLEAGTDLPGYQTHFVNDGTVHGVFEGDMHLKVATERVE